MSGGSFAAVDLGASSGRVMLGHVEPGRIRLEELRRFRNGAVPLPDGLYWDILGLYQDVLAGLRDALSADDGLRSVAIDSWAVDYGLLDADGSLVGNPMHYRDDRTAAVIEHVHAVVPPERLYAINGLQYLPFNTLYQFAADPRVQRDDAGRGDVHALLVPDLLGYWLTGERITEETNASTTGLLDARTGRWSDELFDALGLPGSLLAPLAPPGTVIGAVAGQAASAIGAAGLRLSTVGSHDTASAVVGVPASTERFGYISCGTWGLVGVELDAPVLTDQSRQANFTNERGVDGTIRYLRNVMGLWLLSETLRTWELRGPMPTLAELVGQAGELPAGGPRFDPDDPVFLPPGDMPARIERVLTAAGTAIPASPAALVRCILDSLAAAFAAGIADAERLSGRPIDVIHVVGGGSQNAVLCQLTADAAGRTVVAGPVEATALGNLLIQARTGGVLAGGLWSLRAELRATVQTRSYSPRPAP